MNCFVIMPFSAEFDDVYMTIKSTVENAVGDTNGRCFRLDESRPAGRITDRLLSELRAASICIADLTENKPNVMWELGFAMALEKPTIIITQSLSTLPFDIYDMQSIEYNRNRLGATLGAPLKKSVLDTLGAQSSKKTQSNEANAATVGILLNEMAQLKSMVAEVVEAWKSDASDEPKISQTGAQALVGNWLSVESGSHVYSRIVRGDLVSPYCYGDNSELTGIYFGWRRIGEHWFARYQWIISDLSGFSFLRMDSLEKMSGAWWSSDNESRAPTAPPRSEGVASTWIKQANTSTPDWAEEVFEAVESEGLAGFLAKHR
jgi:hypothetical protein